MNKTISSIAIACLTAAIITGCGDKDPVPGDDFECKQENVLAPKWTCVPEVKGSYAGVGVAQKSAAGMGYMRKVAAANGRSDLAQQIKSQIKDKFESFTSTTGVSDAETVDQATAAVTKQVAKVDLEDSKGVDVWTSPSGSLYMLVTVPEATVNNVVKNTVKTSFKNENALWQKFQLKNALEELDKEFPSD